VNVCVPLTVKVPELPDTVPIEVVPSDQSSRTSNRPFTPSVWRTISMSAAASALSKYECKTATDSAGHAVVHRVNFTVDAPKRRPVAKTSRGPAIVCSNSDAFLVMTDSSERRWLPTPRRSNSSGNTMLVQHPSGAAISVAQCRSRSRTSMPSFSAAALKRRMAALDIAITTFSRRPSRAISLASST